MSDGQSVSLALDRRNVWKLGRPWHFLKDAMTYREFIVVSTQNRPSFLAKRIVEVRMRCPSEN